MCGIIGYVGPRRAKPLLIHGLERLEYWGYDSVGLALLEEIQRLNAELDGSGRIVVRPSGTEPVVRVLAEAENPWKARELCARISALVTRELG